MEVWEGVCFGEEIKEFNFGHVKFEMTFRYSSGAVGRQLAL